jgi:hypothetical protein
MPVCRITCLMVAVNDTLCMTSNSGHGSGLHSRAPMWAANPAVRGERINSMRLALQLKTVRHLTTQQALL